MPVIDSEERATRPVLLHFSVWWLHDIKHNTDSVLVVISYNPLMSIYSITKNSSVTSNRAFGRRGVHERPPIPNSYYDLMPWLQGHIIVFRWLLCTHSVHRIWVFSVVGTSATSKHPSNKEATFFMVLSSCYSSSLAHLGFILRERRALFLVVLRGLNRLSLARRWNSSLLENTSCRSCLSWL